MAEINAKNSMSTVVNNLNGATDNGTRIAKKGDGMDKNAFFKILAAELANQDPSNTKDSTAYVAQLAQFSSLEQMSNLNSTMSFSSAAGYVGKKVCTNLTDDDGLLLSGIANNVSKNGDTIKLDVMTGKGIKEVNYTDIIGLATAESSDITSSATLIGKTVKVNSIDGSSDVYQGVVKGVSKTDTGISLKVEIATKEFNREMVLMSGKADVNPNVKGIYTGAEDSTIQLKYSSASKGYDYKIFPGVDWTPMKDAYQDYQGIRISRPTANPTGDATWNIMIKAQAAETKEMKEIPSGNLIEVVGN